MLRLTDRIFGGSLVKMLRLIGQVCGGGSLVGFVSAHLLYMWWLMGRIYDGSCFGYEVVHWSDMWWLIGYMYGVPLFGGSLVSYVVAHCMAIYVMSHW